MLVLRHGGGVRGKKLLDLLRSTGVPTVACDVIKSDSDKSAFVTAELRRAGRRADAAAVRALVDAVGSDLRELAAACAQLVADTSGLIGADVVERYYGGRIEATGFRVADAAVAGNAGQAVALLRHALATGVDPVPIVAALAAKLRVLAKVAAVRGRGAGAVRDLGLAPWQTDRAMSDLRRWTPGGPGRRHLGGRAGGRRGQGRGAGPAVRRRAGRPAGGGVRRQLSGRPSAVRPSRVIAGPSASPCSSSNPSDRHSSTSASFADALGDEQRRRAGGRAARCAAPTRSTSRTSIFT